MVGVINPTKDTSLEKQRQAAISAPFQLLPGQPWPAEGNTLGSGSESASMPSSLLPSGNSTVKHSHRISGGAIAGIVIGVMAALIIAGLLYFIARSKPRPTTKGPTAPQMPFSGGNVEVWSPVTLDGTPQGESLILSPVTQLPPVDTIGYNLPMMNFYEKPPLSPPIGHPAFGPNSTQSTTIELPGDEPRREGS
jgi:hypothetical protein